MFLSHISQKFPSLKSRVVPESTIDTSTFALDSVRLIHVKMMMLNDSTNWTGKSRSTIHTNIIVKHIFMLRLSLAISVRAVTIFSSIVLLSSSAINIYLLPQVNNNLFL